MIFVVEGEFYTADDYYTDIDWVQLVQWQFTLPPGWEYNHRYVDREIVAKMYEGRPAEDILKEIMADTPQIEAKKWIMGDITISPDFSAWSEVEEWKPTWDSEWKVTSTTPTTGSPMVLPSSI